MASPITGFDNYTISEDGTVRNDSTGRPLKASVTPKGYKRIVLRKTGDRTTHCFFIHRLVADAFLEKGDNTEVNHINGDKADNRVENLEWCTREQNEQHAIKTGLKGRKFTPNMVRMIRELSLAGMAQTLIAKLIGSNSGEVNRIVSGKRYGWVEA